jgi:lipopolysaccharide export system protein LptA
MTPQTTVSKRQVLARYVSLLGLSLSIALTAPLALAEKADQDKPTNIAADHTESDDLHQIDIFTGNVILTKGTILIRSDKLLVHQDPEGYQSGVATWDGKTPVFFKQKREGFADQYMEGWAERVEYDERTSLVKLFNHAIVKRLEGAKETDQADGDTITYNSDTEKYWVESGGTDGRTHTVIQPKTQPCPAGTSGTPTPVPAGTPLPASGIPLGCSAQTAKPAAPAAPVITPGPGSGADTTPQDGTSASSAASGSGTANAPTPAPAAAPAPAPIPSVDLKPSDTLLTRPQ